MSQLPPGNKEASVVRFKETLIALKKTLVTLRSLEVENFLNDASAEVLVDAIDGFEKAVKLYENYITEAGGTL